jgi:hypothetical protein
VRHISISSRAFLLAALLSSLAACGGSDDDPPTVVGASLASCTNLASALSFPNTSFTAASAVAAGTLTVGGTPVPAHCQVTGKMFQRTSQVDGQSYAIGFEMRMPNAWNGRFFYQANGGTDGVVSTATGSVSAGGGLTNALNLGFVVLSSDAGHNGAQNPTFGIDPQARLDYGYQAVGKLTPMAKAVISTAYGKGPDRSYLGGCSNGGRHALVAASRYADQYDGILAGDPGWRLPLAATANVAGYQTYLTLASNPADVSTGFTVAERQLVSNAVAGKCDALDGATDGLIQDTKACQAAFDLNRDVPTCAGARDGTCLSAAQKTGIGKLFAGATTGFGTKIYSSWPWDNGLATSNWGTTWKFGAPTQRDAGAIGFRTRGRVQRHDLRRDQQPRHAARQDTGDERDLCREFALVHDPAASDRPIGVEESRRQAHGLSRHQRSDLLERRQRRLHPGPERRQWRKRHRLRAPVPDPRDEPLRQRPVDRSVRHAEPARQLGREGRGARPRDRQRARPRQPRRHQWRCSGGLVAIALAAALSLSASRALQRQRQPGDCVELHLSVKWRAGVRVRACVLVVAGKVAAQDLHD